MHRRNLHEWTNADRANRAADALRSQEYTEGLSVHRWEEYMLSDLVSDLMHLCDRDGYDIETMLERARNNYRAEADEEE